MLRRTNNAIQDHVVREVTGHLSRGARDKALVAAIETASQPKCPTPGSD